jgi:putative transposase
VRRTVAPQLRPQIVHGDEEDIRARRMSEGGAAEGKDEGEYFHAAKAITVWDGGSLARKEKGGWKLASPWAQCLRMSASDEIQYFDPRAAIRATANRLPHWEQDERTYFITFRTADSLPAEIVAVFHDEREAWLTRHPRPWDEKTEREYWERFGQRSERWLDEGYGACPLRRPELARLVGNALGFHEGRLYRQRAWVVMPNHVHCLVSLSVDATLARVLHSWKSFTANEINRRLGTSGPFWQKDYFDRLIRSPEHFWRCARYIRHNPAKLRAGESLLWEADWIGKTLVV